MRNLVLYTLISLDGVAEEPGDWFFDDGRDVFENLAQIIETQDAVVLGRGTYEYWADYWPTSDVEPFASFINSTPKHVFTSSDLQPTWPNTNVVHALASDYLTSLKSEAGADIGVHGSITLTQSLLADGVVDELRLVIAPTLAGSGRKLFTTGTSLTKLELTDVRRSAAGTLFAHYHRAR